MIEYVPGRYVLLDGNHRFASIWMKNDCSTAKLMVPVIVLSPLLLVLPVVISRTAAQYVKIAFHSNEKHAAAHTNSYLDCILFIAAHLTSQEDGLRTFVKEEPRNFQILLKVCVVVVEIRLQKQSSMSFGVF